MAVVTLAPAAEAAIFTLGCAAIHAQRRHAELLTDFLVLLGAIVLAVGAFLITPTDLLGKATLSETLTEVEAFLPPQSE